MDQVLGRTAGNALEVREAIDVLRDGTGEPRLVEVTLELARAALELVGVDAEPEAALHSGAAAERFARMVAALGGPADLLDAPEQHLAEAPVRREVHRARASSTGIDVRALGLVVMELGGGRRRETDGIDPAVGLTDVAGLGEDAARLATVHARDEQSAAAAEDAVRAAMTDRRRPVDAAAARRADRLALMAELPPEVRELFEGANFAHLATLTPGRLAALRSRSGPGSRATTSSSSPRRAR